VRKTTKTKKNICGSRRDSNPELKECMSKQLRFEPEWSVGKITVWTRKTQAAERPANGLPLE
jgi:hypothetical protein